MGPPLLKTRVALFFYFFLFFVLSVSLSLSLSSLSSRALPFSEKRKKREKKRKKKKKKRKKKENKKRIRNGTFLFIASPLFSPINLHFSFDDPRILLTPERSDSAVEDDDGLIIIC
ncbi:hypothetical protein ACOSQ3_028350 [Xanthoceras sorbifolium]